FQGPAVAPLGAGSVLNLTGPNGNKQFPAMKTARRYCPSDSDSGLASPAPLYMDPGTYTVDNGAGGADIGPFTADFDDSGSVVRLDQCGRQYDRGSLGGNRPSVDRRRSKHERQHPGLGDRARFGVQDQRGGSFTCIVPNNGEFFVTQD